MTDPWVYRSPSGEILTIAPVWDDDAEEWVYVTREDNRLVIVTGAAQEQVA